MNLGPPFDEYGRRLLAAEEAGSQAWSAVVADDANAVSVAELVLEFARDDVQNFEMDLANAWLLGMRLALKYYPSNLVAFLDDAKEMVEEWEIANRRLWMAEARR